MNTAGNYYDPRDRSVRRLGILLIAAGILMFLLFTAAAFHEAGLRRIKSQLQTESLCTLEKPCRLEVVLSYDKEPVDMNLVSPSGQIYSSRNADFYEIQEGRIIMSVTARELGDWGIQYNYNTNRDLSVQANQLFIDQVVLTDIQRYTNDPKPGEDLDYYISVLAQFGDGSDKTTRTKCLITAFRTSGPAVELYAGELVLNTKTNLELDLDNLPSGTYTLKVQTYGRYDGTELVAENPDPYADSWEEELTWENPKEP